MNIIAIISLLAITLYLLFGKRKINTKNILNMNKNIEQDHFFFKGKTKKYIIQNIFRGIIGIGGAGSGKTFSYIKPLLAFCIKHMGVLSFDPKGELSGLINEASKKANKPIVNFSLDNNLDKINPITLCQDKSDILDFSSYFLSGIVGIPQNDNAKYFFNAAKSVLTGVIIYLKNKDEKYASIPHVVALFLTVQPEELIRLLSSDEEAKRSATILLSVKKDPKLLGSIISTFTAFFSSLDVPRIFNNLVTTEKLNLPNNPENPSVLNLVFNLQKRDLYSPIYSSIVGIVLKKMNQPDQHESAVIIDEFTCLSIPDFQNIPETARSNKIATCIAIQDLSQLITKYGKEIASSIISNMGTQLLFRSTNPETLRHFKEMLGTREKKQRSVNSSDFSFKTSKTISKADKDIINNEKIINYRPGECTAIIAEGSHSLIESDRINGNHYLKDLDKEEFSFKNSDDEMSTYKQVYDEIDFLINGAKPQAPKPFNL